VTPTSLTEAPGSPYAIASSGGLSSILVVPVLPWM
jgi:hypothetical protein